MGEGRNNNCKRNIRLEPGIMLFFSVVFPTQISSNGQLNPEENNNLYFAVAVPLLTPLLTVGISMMDEGWNNHGKKSSFFISMGSA